MALGRATALPIHEVTNNLRVEPNHVYVIPPNTNLGIAEGVLTLRPRPKTRTPQRSIDTFLEALADLGYRNQRLERCSRRAGASHAFRQRQPPCSLRCG
jgi:chemotaxis response regulator CheB